MSVQLSQELLSRISDYCLNLNYSEEKIKKFENKIRSIIELDKKILSRIKKDKICVACKMDPVMCVSRNQNIDCSGITSHTIPENQLKLLGTKVTTLFNSFESYIKENTIVNFKPLGYGDASTFVGFCSKCDQMFKCVDRFPITGGDWLLFWYRDVSRLYSGFEASEEEYRKIIIEEYIDVFDFLQIDFEKLMHNIRDNKIKIKMDAIAYYDAYFNNKKSNLPEIARQNGDLFEYLDIKIQGIKGCVFGTAYQFLPCPFNDIGNLTLSAYACFWVTPQKEQCISIMAHKSVMSKLKSELNNEDFFYHFLALSIIYPPQNMHFNQSFPTEKLKNASLDTLNIPDQYEKIQFLSQEIKKIYKDLTI